MCLHWRGNSAATWWWAVGFISPSRLPLQCLGPLVGLGSKPGPRLWPSHSIQHYHCWGSTDLTWFSLLSRDWYHQCQQHKDFCPASTPRRAKGQGEVERKKASPECTFVHKRRHKYIQGTVLHPMSHRFSVSKALEPSRGMAREFQDCSSDEDPWIPEFSAWCPLEAAGACFWGHSEIYLEACYISEDIWVRSPTWISQAEKGIYWFTSLGSPGVGKASGRAGSGGSASLSQPGVHLCDSLSPNFFNILGN